MIAEPIGLTPAPAKVQSVTATAGVDGVTVNWPAQLGLRYHVERSENRQGWRRIAWFVTPSFLDTQGGSGQWYRVIPVANDLLGPPSDPVQASWLFMPIGSPLDDGLLLVALASGAEANQFWREHVPSSYRGMLTLDGWRFDLRRMAFMSPAGIVMGDEARKALIESFIDSVRHSLQALTVRMTRGRITLSEWEIAVAAILRQFYTAMMCFGVGGLESVTPEDQKSATGLGGKIGLAFSLDRLARFARSISTEQDNEDDVLIRVGLYADAAYPTMEEARRSRAARATEGSRRLFLFERNVLDDLAHHCHSTEDAPGCPEVTEQGWQRLGTLPPIGTRQCIFRCRCHFEFSIQGSP